MLNLKFPEVRRIYRAAVGHHDAARSLLGQCPEKTPSTRGHEVVYLSGYVAECSLKALLVSQFPRNKHSDVIERFKSEVKHNLERLRAELTTKGVHFPKNLQELLRRVHASWNSEMRYDVRTWRRDIVERVFDAAETLLDWTRGG